MATRMLASHFSHENLRFVEAMSSNREATPHGDRGSTSLDRTEPTAFNMRMQQLNVDPLTVVEGADTAAAQSHVDEQQPVCVVSLVSLLCFSLYTAPCP